MLFKWKLALRSRILFVSTGKVHWPRSRSLLYFDIRNIYQIRMENNMLALGIRFLQPFSSAGRTFPAYTSRLGYYQQIGSFLQERIR